MQEGLKHKGNYTLLKELVSLLHFHLVFLGDMWNVCLLHVKGVCLLGEKKRVGESLGEQVVRTDVQGTEIVSNLCNY